MTKYTFIPHVNVTTKPMAVKLANKHGFTLEELGEFALWYIIGANVKNGKQEQFLEEVNSFDLTSDEFFQFQEDLSSQEDFLSLMESLKKTEERGRKELEGKQKKTTAKKRK